MFSWQQQRWLIGQLPDACDPHPELLWKEMLRSGFLLGAEGDIGAFFFFLILVPFEGNQNKGKISSVHVAEKVETGVKFSTL